MMQAILEVRNIRKRFFATQALDGVSLSVQPGTVHAVIGENGAGKSTLMNIIGGVHLADEGEVLLEGKKIEIQTPHDAKLAGIGFVHQEIALCQHISVAENVFMAASSGTLVNFKDIHAETKKLLADFEGHAHIDPRQKVRELSISQQQVIEIVKALSSKCKVIIFDEPTAALTEAETEVLFRIIGTLKAKGLGILYISHRMAEIYRIADEVTILRDGLWIDTKNVSEIDQVALVNRMVGRDLKEIYPAKNPNSANAKTTLEVRGLSLEGVFRDVSFDLRAGEILGFSGLVGSGRTDVARTICGLYEKSAGTVVLNGVEVNPRNYRDSIRKGIVYLTENRALEGLFLDLGVAQNISVMDLDKVARFSLIQRRVERALASRYVDKMQIKLADVSQKANSLSGGNQQKVLIAKLLSVSPKVVIMDEPTRGIDIGAKAQIYHLLRQLASEGIGVIMISSELPEVIGVCDRVAVMYEGSLCAVLEGDDVNEQSIIQKACLSEQGEA